MEKAKDVARCARFYTVSDGDQGVPFLAVRIDGPELPFQLGWEVWSHQGRFRITRIIVLMDMESRGPVRGIVGWRVIAVPSE